MPDLLDDPVESLLDALEVYVDERVKVALAPPELRTARERPAHAARQSLEIAVRRALGASTRGEVSRIPTLYPRTTRPSPSTPVLVMPPAPQGEVRVAIAPLPVGMPHPDPFPAEPSVPPEDESSLPPVTP